MTSTDPASPRPPIPGGEHRKAARRRGDWRGRSVSPGWGASPGSTLKRKRGLAFPEDMEHSWGGARGPGAEVKGQPALLTFQHKPGPTTGVERWGRARSVAHIPSPLPTLHHLWEQEDLQSC